MGKKNIFSYFFGIIIFMIIVFIFSSAELITDYYWFSALSYPELFLIKFKAGILLFFISALLFFMFAAFNIWISSKFKKESSLKNILPFKYKLLIISLLSIFLGTIYSSEWITVFEYINQAPFNVIDPIFGLDVAFYVYSLPFYQVLWRFVFITILITLILVLINYFQMFIANLIKTGKHKTKFNNSYNDYNPINEQKETKTNVKFDFLGLKTKAMVHISSLIASIFFLFSIKHYLGRYAIMYSEKGILTGAGYTDVNVLLPIIGVLIIYSLFLGLFILVWGIFLHKKQIHTKKWFSGIFLGYFIISLFGTLIIPALVQSFIVSPNEINLEKPFIENNIKYTKIAYGLTDVSERDYDVQSKLNKAIIQNHSETIENIRILDWRPLTQTYKQTQEIRLYYDLSEVDIDRYDINGKYTEVMLSPRELNQYQIDENAKTWVNLHMIYTHGYGVVMSPVNSVTKEGLPNYYIKDIPPIYTVDKTNIEITQPEIYYGEIDNDYVLVNTETKEFDYPKGNSNEYVQYSGEGGIVLNSFLKKLFFAIRFGDIKLLLSSDISPESKIMFNRNIKDRISKLTPFITLDEDPYLVISEGKLYWIQDGYTLTDKYPYSEKYMGQNNDFFYFDDFYRINYVRNSVKVVVDAYNGDVTYYITDPNEPIMKTYSKIYKSNFKSIDEMPKDLRDHVRYPEELFVIQSRIYLTYHMNDPTVYYNKEDAWEIPNELYGTNQQIPVEPYYIVMKLPGESEEEFVLMSSFTPIRKDNMVAWFAARSDGDNYGKLIVYKFPKDKLIYGPSQIEAKIDQDSEISQQLTLWSQQGSNVARGNLIIIPIENSLLYVEPLYIQSDNGQLPELKRVIVSDGESVVMETNLGEALNTLFGYTKKTSSSSQDLNQGSANIDDLSDQTDKELIDSANIYYENILNSMKIQNWTGIGENLENLGNVLEEMQKNK